MRICGAYKCGNITVSFTNCRGCCMTWHRLHSFLTTTATVTAICTTEVDLGLQLVELQLESALCLFLMAEVAGVLTCSHVVSFSRSSNVKFVRANTYLLINSAESACKSMLNLFTCSHVVSFSRSSNVKFVRANTYLLMERVWMAHSPIHLFGGHCVAQDVILGLGATFALYVRASPIVTLVALQEVAVSRSRNCSRLWC
jgi:hypothetical protein